MLSERQRAAAHRLGQDVCVVAGPGSGKTSVLIERFSWLIRSHGVLPRRILAITFTEKAATEIRQRLLKAFAGDPVMRSEIERAWVSTIHSFCARLLRENAVDAGIDPQFAILEQSFATLREVADEALQGMFDEDSAHMRRFLRSLAVATERDGFVPDLATSLIHIYEAIRLAGGRISNVPAVPHSAPAKLQRIQAIAAEIANDDPRVRTDKQTAQHEAAREWALDMLTLNPGQVTEQHVRSICRGTWNKQQLVKGSAAHRHEDELREICKPVLSRLLHQYYEAERGTIIEALERIDRLYRQRKQNASTLDFDDLEEDAIRLLESNSALREQVRNNFDFILMDELQDTNPLQWHLMALVRRPETFFAVGDVNQSIYGFRHARPELFARYRETLENTKREVDRLRDNYRSSPAILQQINRLFKGAPGLEPHELSAGRDFTPKSMESVEALIITGENNASAERMEALWVAKRITELVGHLRTGERTVRYGDIAILTRANYSTADLQIALDRFRIPSVVVGGLTLFDTREVRDLRLILEVLVNPLNEVALAGLLRSPIFGLSDEDLLRLCSEGSLSEGLQTSPPAAWSTIERLRTLRNQVSPDRLIRAVLDECGYEADISERSRANISRFLSMLRDRYARRPRALAPFVEELDTLLPEAEAPPSDFADAVRLMTIHKAKGLEFPVVFLPFLHKGRNTGFPVISWSEPYGLGVKWRNPVNSDGVGDPVWVRNQENAKDVQKAEENRLLYVACTRAEEHLIFSWCKTGVDREAWCTLLAPQLGIPPDDPEQEVRRGGIRVFRTDQAPEIQRPLPGTARAGLVPIMSYAERVSSAESAASVTDISLFSECPRKYYLARYLGAQSPGSSFRDDDDGPPQDRNKVDAGELGVQVHAALSGASQEPVSEEANQLAERFRQSDLGRRLRRASKTAHEWDFVISIGEMVVRGQIDLWFEHNRELVLVDYKTDRNPLPATVEAHGLQLQIYATALGRALRKIPDRAVLFFLRKNEQVDVDVSPLAIGAATEVCHSFKLSLSNLTFPLRAGQHCHRCEFFNGVCPATLS